VGGGKKTDRTTFGHDDTTVLTWAEAQDKSNTGINHSYDEL
jgi:hypothetical protein